MVLVDTSVWITIFRDSSGQAGHALQHMLGEQDVALTRFHALELLQGAKDDQEWDMLQSYLEPQEYLELLPPSWATAARIYFDLRRQGLTVRSPIDCCIAQIALDYDVLLIHQDKDFHTIARIRPLRHQWFQ